MIPADGDRRAASSSLPSRARRGATRAARGSSKPIASPSFPCSIRSDASTERVTAAPSPLPKRAAAVSRARAAVSSSPGGFAKAIAEMATTPSAPTHPRAAHMRAVYAGGRAYHDPMGDGAATRYEANAKIPIGTPTTLRLPVHAYRGRLTGMYFETSKSFLLPGALDGMQGLVDYFLDHPGCKLLVVGHTDSKGDAAYNLALSEERAQSIADFLREDHGAWLAWFGAAKPAEKRWGTREVQPMLSVLPPNEEPFYEGPPSGKDDPTKSAVTAFQLEVAPERQSSESGTREALVKGTRARWPSLPAALPWRPTVAARRIRPSPQAADEEPKNRRAEGSLRGTDRAPRAESKRGVAPSIAVGRACVETLDFSDGPLAETRKLELALSGDGCSLVIFDESGAETMVLSPGEATASAGWLRYALDPTTLPNPARFVRRSAECEEHVGGPCDPIALRDALRRQEWDAVDQLLVDRCAPR